MSLSPIIYSPKNLCYENPSNPSVWAQRTCWWYCHQYFLYLRVLFYTPRNIAFHTIYFIFNIFHIISLTLSFFSCFMFNPLTDTRSKWCSKINTICFCNCEPSEFRFDGYRRKCPSTCYDDSSYIVPIVISEFVLGKSTINYLISSLHKQEQHQAVVDLSWLV